MTKISIRLDDIMLEEMKKKANLLHLSQTDYIRKAIALLNHETGKLRRKKRLMQASMRVRKQSLAVNKEISGIDYDIKD